MTPIKCFLLTSVSARPNPNGLWKRTDTGETIKFPEAPVGAMYVDTWTWPTHKEGVLTVKTPDGEWPLDIKLDDSCMERHGHTEWERSGEPPAITVTPSAKIRGRRWWLKDGVLSVE